MKPSQLRARYWRIVFFFGRVTAGFIFWEIFLPRIGLGGWAARTRSERNRRIAVRFRALAIRMGGLMIKVGQFLSATARRAAARDHRRALRPAGRGARRGVLGDPRRRPRPSSASRSPSTTTWFDETPLAAASLGQVHRARLCEADAELHGFADVVVKVQRPHIEQVVEVDLAALRRVGGWLQRYKPVSERADVRALVEEFATTTREEIDYLAEGRNAETFATNFAGQPARPRARGRLEPDARAACSRSRTSRRSSSATTRRSPPPASTARQVATVLLDTYMQQIFEDGFFHADPHPGNLFVTPLEGVDEDGNRNWQLTFVDFGMVGRVPENLRDRPARGAHRRRDAGRARGSWRASRRSTCCCPAPTSS